MLMITVETEAANVTLRLDGRLAGPEARELARGWSAAAFKQPHQRVLLDLTGVTSIDGVGKEFLSQATRNGDRLVGGVTTRAIVEEIMAGVGMETGLDGESGAFRDGFSGTVHALVGS
jgi:anti-anti-sigma regulatory factor